VNPARDTTHFPNITVQLENALVSGAVMQAINILGDQGETREDLLKLQHRQMARVRLDPGNQLAPPTVPFPNTLRVSCESLGRRQVFDPVLVPQPVLPSKRWHTAFSRNAGSCENHNACRGDQ
jgi:hypothetical protein